MTIIKVLIACAVSVITFSNAFAKDEKYVLRVIGLLKERAEYLQDLILMGKYFFEEPTTYDPDLSKKWDSTKNDFLLLVANELENLGKTSEWAHGTIETTIKSSATTQEIPIGKVMPMFRLAVSGVGFGPVVFDIMEHLGAERTVQRIRKAVEAFK